MQNLGQPARHRPRRWPRAAVKAVTAKPCVNWYGSAAVEPFRDNAPRILILEPDTKVRSTLLRYAVKGWQGAAVQSTSGSLVDALGDLERLKSFDVLLVGCDFSKDGTAENPTLQALRASRPTRTIPPSFC